MLAIVLAGLATPAGAGPEAPADLLAPLHRALERDLEELAAWAHERKLYRSRDETCELLLRIDPNHLMARERLRYEREPGGTWERKRRYRPPPNMNRNASKAWKQRRAELGDRHADAFLALLESRAADVPADARARMFELLAVVAAHRADIREANGEVRDESDRKKERWILAESAGTEPRRSELARAARLAVASAARPRPATVRGSERALGLTWTAAVATPRVRVLSTLEEDEASRCAQHAEAAFVLYPLVFGEPAPKVDDLTLYVVASRDESKAFVDRHPAIKDKDREFLVKLNSAWVPGRNHVVTRSPTTEHRIEVCARQPLSNLIRRRFGITSKQGWAFEGFGGYLTHRITGTHLCYFVRRSNYEEDRKELLDELWKTLQSPEADWIAEGRRLLLADDPPSLRLLLGKDVNAMTGIDLVHAYVLAAYLMEGRPDQVTGLLDAVGKKTPIDDALRTTLGLDVETLERRLRRWLEETAD